MKSAYLVLGVPGNANKEDIEVAFNKANIHYSPARLAADPQAVDRFLEVKTAYQVLRDDESRAAHDRKLSSTLTRPAAARLDRTIKVEQESSGLTRVVVILAVGVAMLFAGSFYISSKREAARKEQAAQELRLKVQAEEDARKEELRLAAEEANRQQIAKQAAQQERQFRQESERAINNVRSAEAQRSYLESQRASAEQREAQRKEYEAQSREQNKVREAQNQLARDKARIRELCYQNYRRWDC
ncbi:DnaJ domain-containing protein [Polaromonas sp. P5_D5]